MSIGYVDLCLKKKQLVCRYRKKKQQLLITQKPRNIEGLAIAIRKRSDPGPVLCIFSKDMKQKFWEIGVGEKEIQV